MKKWMVGIVAGVLILFVVIYFSMPSTVTLSQSVALSANSQGVYRKLADTAAWGRGWAGNEAKRNNAITIGGTVFRPEQPLFNGLALRIENGGSRWTSGLTLLPLRVDSTGLLWRCEMPLGKNPVKKFEGYLQSRRAAKSMSQLLSRMKAYFDKPENVYDLQILQTNVVDTFLISTRLRSAAYPSTAVVYGLINGLKEYAQQKGATQKGYPMLHVAPVGKETYETMVALPVDRMLPNAGAILFKRMVAGYILVAEVRGGEGAVQHAMTQLENYANDYGRISPALSFASLVTDRTMEKDTAKWMTRVYYPVL